MNFNQFLATSLLLMTSGLTFPLVTVAQNPPASTFQPGPWQPIARVDTQRPVGVKIINQTDILLDYDLTANVNASPVQINPGEPATLKTVRIPAYILINRSVSTSEFPTYSLIYAVSVDENNMVTVTVTKGGNDSPGYSTLNINRQGAIFAY
ncbi:hypothetical protein C7H19_00625 [Aphanothece hegewaldii CCALA 016]|uniref:DUF2808 domain-containing protein n=1 Tax=Aphanothece hegewaldii CCALA 016 TaxID=2107694 RepID=A0A2T1M3C0_9CHRO|nr:hypothetical protein [Aphanothece hegewaldii]PSF39325.1 hypothetical protein C7H19_00625 [Aphanothece hegewaldii CCALA 016]